MVSSILLRSRLVFLLLSVYCFVVVQVRSLLAKAPSHISSKAEQMLSRFKEAYILENLLNPTENGLKGTPQSYCISFSSPHSYSPLPSFLQFALTSSS